MSDTSDILNERWVAEGRFVYTEPTDADDCVEIARCGMADSPSNLYAQAIAALPECLEALRGLLSVMNEDEGGDWFICVEDRDTVDAARAALAKAGVGGAE